MDKITLPFKTGAGFQLEADVYPCETEGPNPVILWLHGGALIMGTRAAVHPVLSRALSRQGCVQVSIDYRLAPETKLPDIADDVQDALAWIRQDLPRRFSVDVSRIGVIGRSAGGYLALTTGYLGDPPKAVVSFYGYGDIVAPWYTEPDAFYCREPAVGERQARAIPKAYPVTQGTAEERRAFYLYCRQQGSWPREVTGRDPEVERAWFERFCPERNVSPKFPPTLLLHGTDDTDVPYSQSVAMAAALARNGVPHELVTIQGGGHGFDHDVGEPEWGSPEPSSETEALLHSLEFLRRLND